MQNKMIVDDKTLAVNDKGQLYVKSSTSAYTNSVLVCQNDYVKYVFATWFVWDV